MANRLFSRSLSLVLFSFAILFVSLGITSAAPGGKEHRNDKRDERILKQIGKRHAVGEVLVKFRKDVPKKQRAAIHAAAGGTLIKRIPRIGVDHVKGGKGRSTEALLHAYSRRPDVEYAEPNYACRALLSPNDPLYSELWGLNNTGQTGGTVDADIDAPEAWDRETGSPAVIIANIDTGVERRHPDLAANIWTNPGEIPDNGVDDDLNGYIDDYRGWNFVANSKRIIDDNGHGTHTSGTSAAVGNNGVGITGVAWQAKIMAVKFLDSRGTGWVSDGAKAIIYAADMGARVSNNSWGGPRSFTLDNAISYANDKGMLIVAAAGNDGGNNDLIHTYPCFSRSPNVICVAATDHNDGLAWFSNYGAGSVDLAAPGVNVLSTVPDWSCPGCLTSPYDTYNGTSMATPHVSGAAALIVAQEPGIPNERLKRRLLDTVDRIPSVHRTVASGGRLNSHRALAQEFSLSLTPRDVGVPLDGATAEVTVTVHSLAHQFSGPVTLAIDSPEPSITATFSVNPVTPPVYGAGDSLLTLSTTVDTPRNNYTINVIGTDAEGNEASFPLRFVVEGPDFIVDMGDVPKDVVPGGAAAYTTRVNSYGAYTGDVNLSFLSDHAGITGRFDPAVVTVPALGSVDSQLTVSASADAALGRHELTVIGKDGIKTRRDTTTVNVVDRDLIVTAVTVPASAGMGAVIPVAVTIANTGTFGDAKGFNIRYYLSTDAVITPDDDFLVGYYVPGLAAGSSYTDTRDLTVPFSYPLTPGRYYWGVIVDKENWEVEVNDANNWGASGPIEILGPDLAMTEVSGPSEAVAGTPIQIANTFENQGSGLADHWDYLGTHGVTLSLATAPSEDAIVKVLASSMIYRTIAPGEVVSDVADGAIPIETKPGTYYFIGKVSIRSTEALTDRDNNTLVGNAVVIRDPVIDLVPTAISYPVNVKTGEAVNASVTIANNGPETAHSFELALYLSDDTLISRTDTRLLRQTIGSLAGNASWTGDIPLTIPTGIGAGPYYLGVIVDEYNFRSETDETNNTLSGPAMTVALPDLAAISVNGPQDATVGQWIPITFTVRNDGAGLSQNTTASLMLSSDTVITANDVRVGTLGIPELAAGATYEGSQNVFLSSNLPGGSWHIGILADGFNQVPEVSEENNAAAGGTMYVTAKPALTTQAADTVTQTGAMLHGEVSPFGIETTYWFEVGTTIWSYTYQSPKQSAGAGREPVAVHFDMTGQTPNTRYYFRVVAQNAYGITYGDRLFYDTLAEPPAVTTGDAADITLSTAVLSGTANPKGVTGKAWFEYGPDANYGTTTARQTVTGSADTTVSARISGLVPGAPYHYRVVAQNNGGIVSGTDRTFTVYNLPPLITTDAAVAFSTYSARFDAVIDPRGRASRAWVEFGRNNAFDQQTAVVDIAAGIPRSISIVTSSLSANTTYQYRLVAENLAGRTIGSEQSFTTLALPPSATTLPVVRVGKDSATLAGTADSKGVTGTVWFEYGTTTAYGSTTPAQPISGDAIAGITAEINGLVSGTTYHYRVMVENNHSVGRGTDMTFTTKGRAP